MSNRATVGEVISAFLENCGVTTAFGVISIHNLPILDAFGQRGKIRFVPARGEAGAVNMADAYARVSGSLGVAVTSTGTAAGNAAGAMVEALTAGTPVLHLTGQIETPYLDRNHGYIHEAPRQLDMLRAISKDAFRVCSSESALAVITEAVQTALTVPTGPVSVEIPIDIQAASIAWPSDLQPLPIRVDNPSPELLDELANRLARARRSLLWLGGGARRAGTAVRELVRLGFGVVTSVQGRGILPEDHPLTLGASNFYDDVERFYESCDAVMVVGSRLRSNETLKYKLKLPQPLYRIDADPQAENRCYQSDLFVCGDAAVSLEGLVHRLRSRMEIDPSFASDLAVTRRSVEAQLRKGLGPYAQLVDTLQEAVGRDFVWVRDVTVANSTWGNRLLKIFGPLDGVHALGGGIGQGIPMGIGASLGAPNRRTFCLVGDGGLMLNPGELATAVQEKANLIVLVMNDRGYGVIKNIQDAQYGGRNYYVDLHTPDFAKLSASLDLSFQRITDLGQLNKALAYAMNRTGPVMVEFDMQAIGPYASPFAGPPIREEEG